MRPFNLEEAKAGKPVVTRDGRDAVILAFDISGSYPMLGYYISSGCKKEATWDYDGNFYQGNDSRDLFMKSETKTGWVNLYKYLDGVVFATGRAYETREEAVSFGTLTSLIHRTVQITWEE